MKYFIAVCLTLVTIGCAGKNLTPDQTAVEVARYATASVDLVTAVQDGINAYAKEHGRTPALDTASTIVRDRFISAAEDLRTALVNYEQLRRTGIPASNADATTIAASLDAYEQAFESLTKVAIPDGLTQSLANTYFRIRDLIRVVRNDVLPNAA